MDNIQIKSLFSDWHPVSREQARRYVKRFMLTAVAMHGKQLIDYIEQNRLRGCTVAELMKEIKE